MIRYECYDEYGNKEQSIEVEAETLETVIVRSGHKYYRPICYDLNATPNTAKCIPVTVLEQKKGVGKHAQVSSDEERHDL